MSALPQTKASFSADDYLAWEATQPERHEFVDGEIFAMAGAEDRHVTVTGNVYMALRQHLRGTPCRTFMADMKVQADAASSYFYPDIVVTCSAADAQSRQIKREPLLIVEVLSPGTEAYDRGEKFQRYRQMPSLAEYALVDIERRRVDVFRKQPDGLWVLHPFESAESVVLASVDVTLDAETLYAEIDLD
ncbi:MAG: Uma2 family endonuclease [Giesbergeria sp.]|uniref:Uma2 family endonuclease n=1 Tax=Giesbergeria sp. TaxID=2818473 RepID=UPI002623072F|nr:Uma2 family endonuclease [Giesbergeria sp.]MDD2608318.1 Uma2 family endonuclease [Giesbergeria sp.]